MAESDAEAEAAPFQTAPRGFLLGLSLTQLISWGSTFYLFGLLVQPMEALLHIDRSQSAVAFSLMLLSEGAAAIAVGRWIDRGQARWVMSGGSALVALCLLAHTQVSSLIGFYTAWACLGVALSGVLYNPAFAVVTRRYPKDYRRAIIVLTFLGGLASTVFIPLNQWLIQTFSWQRSLVALAALHLLICLPLHAVLLRGEPPKPVAPQDTEKATVSPNDLHTLLRSRVFWLIGSFSTLGMAVTVGLLAHLVPLLQETGLPPAWVVLVPAGIGVLQVCGRLLLYLLEGRLNLHRVNLLTVLLMPVSMVVLGLLMWAPVLSLALPFALLFALLFGLANGMMTIVKGTAVAQYVDQQHVALLNGALGLPIAIGRAITPALIGALWGISHHYGWGVLALFVGSALACLAFAGAQRLARLNS